MGTTSPVVAPHDTTLTTTTTLATTTTVTRISSEAKTALRYYFIEHSKFEGGVGGEPESG